MWTKKKAQEIAKNLNIQLTTEHWQIILIMQKFYKKYNLTPTTHMLILMMKKKYNITFNSQKLFILFSSNAIKNASKIAGLPKPNNCL